MATVLPNGINTVHSPPKIAGGQYKLGMQGVCPENAPDLQLIDLYRCSLASNNQSSGFLFTPVWNSKHERIASYSCELPDGKSRSRKWEVPNMGSAEAQCRLDIMALASAIKGLRHVFSRGEIAAVTPTVNLETLAWSKTRNAYLKVLGQIDSKERRFLAPRIVRVEEGFNLSAIAQWTLGLRSLVDRCLLHLPNLEFEFWRAGRLGVRAIGLSAHGSAAMRNTPNSLTNEAQKLAGLCSNYCVAPYVDNVSSIAELQILQSLGIRNIGGPVIGEPSELPNQVHSLFFL
jgi:hypothetical protein